jgi:hypothetical protein
MADYYAVIMAKVFIVGVFLLGMTSLVIEIMEGTL